jgi:aminomethyltransferase
LREKAAHGLQRRRTGFWVEGQPTFPGHPVAVHLDGVAVGVISELVFSPRLGRSLALGLLRADLGDETAGLCLDLPEGEVGLRPTSLPFKS